MARPRCILPLIVCTFVLVTVITAFRLRDLTAKEVSSHKNPLVNKCSSSYCESDDSERHLSASALKVKEISRRLTYEDVKKAVKEKQQSLHDKKQQYQPHRTTPEVLYNDDSDDADSDDDDGDSDDDDGDIVEPFTNLGTSKESKIKEQQKHTNNFPPSTKVKQNIKSHITNEDDDGSDEDSGEDDGKNDDDDDEDNDSDSEEEEKDIYEGNDEEDEDDDDVESDDTDDSDDSDQEVSELTPKEKEKPNSLIQKSKQVEIVTKNIVIKQQQKFPGKGGGDNDDSDSDSDDKDDSDDEAQTVIANREKERSKLTTPKSKQLDKNQKDHDNDDEVSDDAKSLVKPKRTEAPKIINKVFENKADSSKEVKSASPKQSFVKFQDNHPQSKISPSNDLKSEMKVHHKDYKEQAIEKDKKVNTNIELKDNSKKHQDIKQDLKGNDKSVKAPHDAKKDHKKPEDKTPKEDAQKHKSREGKGNQDHSFTKSETNVKKNTEVKSEHTKPKDEYSDKTIKAEKSRKEKEVLNHASGALYRKNNFLQSEFEDFYAFLPSFAPNFSRIHNPECRRHGQILMRQLRGTKLWALNMLDASGKISSGMLDGNGNQLGNFDQCLESRARVRLDSGHVVRIHGKYCLAQIEARADHPELKLPLHFAQARNLLKSKIDDPGHMIPRFSLLNWGVCLPASCEPQDAEFILRDSLRHYHLAGLNLKIKVDPLNCYTSPDDDDLEQWLEPPTVATVTLFLAIALLVFYATLKDFLARRSSGEEVEKEPTDDDENVGGDNAEKEDNERTSTVGSDEGIVSSFSLYRSYPKLVRHEDSEDIACLHGIRAIGSLFILLAHKVIPVANTPYVNRAALTDLSHSVLSVPLRLGSLLTDAFLLMSGALTAHRLSADHDDEAAPGWFRRFLARYARLTPALLLTVLFYAYVWERLGQGPQWGTLVAHNAELCRESWWLNLLYVQNFMPFEEICATHTYQLALDMQLALVAAALVWSLRTRPILASLALTALQAVTAYIRYTTTVQHRLSLLIYHGASVSQLYRSGTLTYSLPLHRSTPYIAGVALGVLLQRRPNTKLSLLVSLPCWLACAACCTGCLYAALDAASPDTRYSATTAGAYVALAPLALAASLAWLIYVTHSGNAEWINRILRARVLVIVGRLSYALYLIQFIIFFTNTATVKTAQEFTIFSILDIKEFAILFAATTAVTLTLVIPMQSLSKYVMSYQFSPKELTTEKNTEDTNGNSDEPTQIDEPDEQQEQTEKEELKYENHNGKRLMAHREFLEEILEAEIEYEFQRNAREDGLEEILEEEEDELADEEAVEEEMMLEEDVAGEAEEEEEAGEEDVEEDMEVVNHEEDIGHEENVNHEEAERSREDFWGREEEDEVYVPRRLSREDDGSEQDRSDWNGGQEYRFSRYR